MQMQMQMQVQAQVQVQSASASANGSAAQADKYTELDDNWCEALKGELLTIDSENKKKISKCDKKPHWSSCYGKGLISDRSLREKNITMEWCIKIERLSQGKIKSKHDTPQVTIGISSDRSSEAKEHSNGNFSRYQSGIGIDNLGFVSHGYEPMLHGDKSIAYQEGDTVSIFVNSLYMKVQINRGPVVTVCDWKKQEPNQNSEQEKHYRLAVSLWTELDCVSIVYVRMHGVAQSGDGTFDQVVDFSTTELEEWERHEQEQQKMELSAMRDRGRTVSELRTQFTNLQKQNEDFKALLTRFQQKDKEQLLQIERLESTIEKMKQQQQQQSQGTATANGTTTNHTDDHQTLGGDPDNDPSSSSPHMFCFFFILRYFIHQLLPAQTETPQFTTYQELLAANLQLQSEIVEMKVEMQRVVSSKLELIRSSTQEINQLRNLVRVLMTHPKQR
ncbi:hypothetical protein RFI_26131 [Reticulomyxa filosa]|uniref:Uncharacterized protein n=1 Tax=Reticulomyxa filosa TaxID=46433 RepID=X6MDX8_RETFI|nr:hypothetical protein RFI_26131 [Reticulomyxa filosa]|eukprot:ETO11245.1 hypothetical protein RFI_26131 [Reticulomyxa filosa]